MHYVLLILMSIIWGVSPGYADVSLRISNATLSKMPLDITFIPKGNYCVDAMLEMNHAFDLLGIFERRLSSQAVQIQVTIHEKEWQLQLVEAKKIVLDKQEPCTASSAILFVETIYERITGIRDFFHTKVAFIGEEGNPKNTKKQLYWMNLNGSQLESLVPKKPFVLFPRFSQSGNYLSFISFEKHGSRGIRHELYVMNLKTRRLKMIYGRWGESLGSAVFMPGDDNQLIVGIRRGKQRGLFLVERSRPNQAKPLKYNFGFDVEPTLSSDGNLMAFSSLRTGKPMLYTLSMDAIKEKQVPSRLTYVGRYNSSPAFSPDNRWIVFSAFHKNDFDLFKINPIGNLIFKLSELQHDEEAPSFSPDDNKHIVFARNSISTGKSSLHMLHIDFPGVDVPLQMPLKTRKIKVPDWSPVLNFAKFDYDK
jgi:tol-pal system beta propeller repeat protein TolB